MLKGSSELNRATESRAFQPFMAKKCMPNKDWEPGRPNPSRPSEGLAPSKGIQMARKQRCSGPIGTRLVGLVGPACWLAIAWIGLPGPSSQAYVALMAGQRAKPLNGSFNTVPVLHSNQPEEVEGPGILINTSSGVSYAAETGAPLANPDYTFNGEFGVHIHHKYIPPKGERWAGSRRSELTLGLILINTSYQPVHIRFEAGAVRNSFQAPYLANNLMGVKPLGVRAWNTGPGDATATQLLRGKLDSNLTDEITIPGRSRVVLFRTELPSLGIANALLRGSSDGPFQMAVVAAREPQSDYDIVAVLDESKLAPGRVYLRRIAEINNRQIFSRVGGVAIGDTYQASISHDLNSEGPLHVPFTSTNRHNFGTKEIQVNALASRMVDSSLDNVGTYGVRYEVNLNLKGAGPYELVMSHPTAFGRSKPFTAFRGSIQIKTESGVDDIHVGMRSGESLSLTRLNLKPGVSNPIKVTMVYPADATPGHLLSVVSASQLAQARDRDRQEEIARVAAQKSIAKSLVSLIAPPDLYTPGINELGILTIQGNELPAPPPPVNSPQGNGGDNPMNLSQALVQKYQRTIDGNRQASYGLQDR
jgi:hypothetical protein